MKKLLCALLTAVLLVAVVPTPTVQAAPSAAGTDIVEYARNYIGKVPYVWGGKTIDGPNPGADCSGFVCRIYEHFGFNYWKNRTRLVKEGQNLGTDLSLAKPGDLIWFSGHIAIFSGHNSKGSPMIIHETGGDFKNVVETRVSVVHAEIKGVVRLPGVLHDGETSYVPRVTFSMPTDSKYKNKIQIGETSATVCIQITKPAGTSVKTMGIMLFDNNMNLIKRHSETVKVGSGSGSYHSWYDTASELNVTLDPGTDYHYQIFGVFNGEEVQSQMFDFTTTGTPPVQEYMVIFENDNGGSAASSTVGFMKPGDVFSDIPVPENIPAGKEFIGWFDAPSGGRQIQAGDVFTQNRDLTLYPQYRDKPTPTPTPTPTPIPTPQIPDIIFIDPRNAVIYETLPIRPGDTFGKLPVPRRDGWRFLGWFTGDDQEVRSGMTSDFTKTTYLYPHWEEEPVQEQYISMQIDNPRIDICGQVQDIDDYGTTPVIRNTGNQSSTLLPVRPVVEGMGGTVGWNGKTRTVSMSKDGKILFLQIGNQVAWDSDGNTYGLAAEPVIINSRTMLPIRFIAEYFDGTVEWEGKTRTVTIRF